MINLELQVRDTPSGCEGDNYVSVDELSIDVGRVCRLRSAG